MLQPLNLRLVKEWYKLLRGYNMQQQKLAPEHFYPMSEILKNMGGFYQEDKTIYWFFFSMMTSQQLESLRAVAFNPLVDATTRGNALVESYEDGGYMLPCDKFAVPELYNCMDAHIWAAMLSMMPEEVVYACMVRRSDADYNLPSSGYLNFPMCFPHEFSDETLRQMIVPYLPENIEVYLEPILVREMLTYPVIDLDRLEEK